MRDRARDGIRRARRVLLFVSEEGSEISRRREPDAEHERIFHRVLAAYREEQDRIRSSRRFVLGSGLPGNGVVEQSANAHSVLAMVTAPFFAPVGNSPVAETSFAFVVSSDTGGYGEGWPRGIISGVVFPVRLRESQHKRTGDARTVAILRNWYLNRVIRRRRNDVALPAADERDVAIRMRHGIATSAVHDGVQQDAARPHHLRRPHERERDDVFDLAASVARREVDVGDNGVLRIRRVQLAVRRYP